MARRPKAARGKRRAGVLVATLAGVAAFAAIPVSSAQADPSSSDWAKLRNCESSGNYAINTGNGYYGAYQFNLSTWRSVGGTGYPNQASKAEQDARALILYRERGWQPWTCAGIVGLHNDADAGSGRISDIHIGATAPVAPVAKPTSGVPAWPGAKSYKFGDNSTTIKRFQDQMHARGFIPAGTGQYGVLTRTVVVQLQKLNGVNPSGLLGPKTWKLAWTGKYTAPKAVAVKAPVKKAPVKKAPVKKAPVKVSKKAPAWTAPQYYSFGDRSATIKRFQNQMHARGLFPVGTGEYGPQTKKMIVRLQKLNGLTPNGLLGPNTWKLAWTGKY